MRREFEHEMQVREAISWVNKINKRSEKVLFIRSFIITFLIMGFVILAAHLIYMGVK